MNPTKNRGIKYFVRDYDKSRMGLGKSRFKGI